MTEHDCNRARSMAKFVRGCQNHWLQLYPMTSIVCSALRERAVSMLDKTWYSPSNDLPTVWLQGFDKITDDLDRESQFPI